jgi:sugar phosphate isomerase/epimerase
MNKYLVFLFSAVIAACGSPRTLDNPFYAFNNCMRTMVDCPEGVVDQVTLVSSLGFDALGGQEAVDLEGLKDELDRRGMALPEVYIGVYLRDDVFVLPDNWEGMLSLFRGTETLFALHVHAEGYTGREESVDARLLREFTKLAKQAEEFQIQMGIYPHHAFYCETTQHARELAEAVNHPRFGMTLNLCHLLKVEGVEGWEQRVDGLISHLKMVSIHGADDGDTQSMGWDRLIRPLGEGNFDTFRFVSYLRDKGYTGMFGLQCYGIRQDCAEALRKSQQAWRSFQTRYAEK